MDGSTLAQGWNVSDCPSALQEPMGVGEVPCQGKSSLWPLALRKYPHPVSRTAAAASFGLRQREWLGGFFPRIRIWISCLLAMKLEHTLFPT